MYARRTLIALVAATVVGAVAPTAGAFTTSGGRPHVEADQKPAHEPMQSCQPFVPNHAMKPGVLTTIADDFAVPRGEWWCNATLPSGTASFGPRGVTLSIPDYTTLGSTAWTDAEILSRSDVRTGMSMSVRLAPMDLAGVQGSRGWGFWNAQFSNSTGDSALAWFFYQNGTACPGTQCPKGLFVMTQRLGNPDSKITLLPASLLSRPHTYTVTLKKDAVDFYVDGRRIARVADPAFVPTTLMHSHLWVDNMFYSMGPEQFVLAPQLNVRPTRLTARWWWQGPTTFVPMGPTMAPARPGS